MELLSILILFLLTPIFLSLLFPSTRRGSSPKSAQATPTDSQKEDVTSPVATDAGTEVSTLRPIDKVEEKNLRNCFPWSIYYLENIEYRPQAVLCRGKLRANADLAYQTIQENIEKLFGDRFYVLFQESLSGKPFFALVPNPQSHPETRRNLASLQRPGLASALFFVTLFTTTIIGAGVVGVTPKEFQSDPLLLLQGLPYSLALMFILGIHELGHYLAAQFYNIRTTLPYFIPLPPLIFPGTFGAFIQTRSPTPNRKALFDVGLAGPLAGFLVTVPLLLWGLSQSNIVDLTEKSGLLNFQSLNPRSSLFLTLLSKLALGNNFAPDIALNLHPVAVAGYLGLIVTALNLMPVGQLDGGHIVHAMFGQRTGMTIGHITRILVLVLAFLERDWILGAIFLLFMPIMDEPALNDISELDNKRDFCGLLTLALLTSILLPVPETLTKLLQI